MVRGGGLCVAELFQKNCALGQSGVSKNASRAFVTRHVSTETHSLSIPQNQKILWKKNLNLLIRTFQRLLFKIAVRPHNSIFNAASTIPQIHPLFMHRFPCRRAIFMTPLQEIIHFLVMCSMTSQRSHRRAFAGIKPIYNEWAYRLPKIWATCPTATLYYAGLKMPLTLYHSMVRPDLLCHLSPNLSQLEAI